MLKYVQGSTGRKSHTVKLAFRKYNELVLSLFAETGLFVILFVYVLYVQTCIYICICTYLCVCVHLYVCMYIYTDFGVLFIAKFAVEFKGYFLSF